MAAVIVTLLDKATDCGEGIYTYDNEALAYTKLRRSVREAYINGEVDNDWIDEHSFAVVGYFHFGPYNDAYEPDGTICRNTVVEGFIRDDWIAWACIDFVSDIYKAGGEDDN